jgi:hypothetical protein
MSTVNMTALLLVLMPALALETLNNGTLSADQYLVALRLEKEAEVRGQRGIDALSFCSGRNNG